MLRHASAEVGADVVAAVVAIAVSVADGGGGGSSGGPAVFVGADAFCGARPARRNRSREVRLVHLHVSRLTSCESRNKLYLANTCDVLSSGVIIPVLDPIPESDFGRF